MIHYRRNSFLGTDIIFRVYGSVLPYALARASIAGLFCFALDFFQLVKKGTSGWMFHPNPFTFYFQIAALVLAFHMNQAYNRFWEARTALQSMASYWGDVASHLLAFNRSLESSFVCYPLATVVVNEPDDDVEKTKVVVEHDALSSAWRARIVHLLSLLHAVCMEYLLMNRKDHVGVKFDVLGGIHPTEQAALSQTKDHAYLVSYWLKEEVTRCGKSLPTPVMTQAFQILYQGMLAYDQACKIEDTPFPFPYIQLLHIIDWSLLGVTPVVMACWVDNVALAIVLTMLAVGGFHALFDAAAFMESPFGRQYNDLPLDNLNLDFINRLIALLDKPMAENLNEMIVDSHGDTVPRAWCAGTLVKAHDYFLNPPVSGEGDLSERQPLLAPPSSTAAHTIVGDSVLIPIPERRRVNSRNPDAPLATCSLSYLPDISLNPSELFTSFGNLPRPSVATKL